MGASPVGSSSHFKQDFKLLCWVLAQYLARHTCTRIYYLAFILTVSCWLMRAADSLHKLGGRQTGNGLCLALQNARQSVGIL